MKDKIVLDSSDCDLSTVLTIKDTEYARISPDGKLEKFNNKICREVADEFDEDNTQTYLAFAKLCILLLEEAASIVDHINKQGGVSYGDLIRNLEVEEEK